MQQENQFSLADYYSARHKTNDKHREPLSELKNVDNAPLTESKILSVHSFHDTVSLNERITMLIID